MTTDNAVIQAVPSDVAVESARVLSFSIPPQDEEFFATQLPFTVQKEIRRLLNLCSIIHRSDNVTSACKRLAAQHSALGRGYSTSSLRTKYYNYVRTGDWRSMWNKAKAPPQRDGALPAKFVAFVKELAEENQRKIAPAIENLYHIFRTRFDLNGKEHHAIPGYASWPIADDFTGLPVGWSYANLQRKVTDVFQLTAARIGRSAARQHSLKVYTSRVNVACGEYYLFDDHEFNLKINFPGQRRAMRPKGFCAMDLLSACCISKSFKPTLWDETEEKKKVLTERDFMWFVVNLLLTEGYRTDERGTALIVEWGTAAIRAEFEARIHDATRGHVRVERSGKFGAPAHIGQAEGRTHGNFRFKALIESFFNLLDNFLASLPGQVGKDRNHSPEQLHGLERENNQLLQIADHLGVDHGLQFPFLSWPEFLDRALRVFEVINDRKDHKLEGWAKLGFIAKEWRLPGTLTAIPSPGGEGQGEGGLWLPASALESLPDADRQVALALIDSNPTCRRARQLSPMEVWQGRKSELHPLPIFKLPELLGPEFSRTLSVKAGEFTFDDEEIDSDPIRFRAVDPKRGRLDGKFQCYIIPFNPSYLIACDSNNRVQGICERIIPPSRNDIDGIKRMMGEARSWEAEALAGLNGRHIGQAREKAARHAHNANAIEKARTARPQEHSTEPTDTVDLRPGEQTISEAQSAAEDSTTETIDLR